MAGLVAYASSDEDSDGNERPPAQPTETVNAVKSTRNGAASSKDVEGLQLGGTRAPHLATESLTDDPTRGESLQAPSAETTEEQPGSRPPAPAPTSARTQDAPTGNVLIGPSRPPGSGGAAENGDVPTASLPLLDDGNGYDDDDDDDDDDTNSNEPPLSPYSAERAAVRQLTLPRVPDFDIPGSPTTGEAATPADALAALNKKFATFLELKQKRDTHFNARLAQSEAMKNPALMDKLMAFVGLPPNAWGGGGGDPDMTGEDGSGNPKGKQAEKPVDTAAVAAQYATTLPLELWDPAAFPAEAYRRSLRRLQEDAAKQRARAPGERVDFVAAAPTPSGGTPGATGGYDGSERASRAGTPAAATGKRKTRFD